MKELIIIGNDSFSRLIQYYLTQYTDRSVVAFSVDSQYIPPTPPNTCVPPQELSVVPFETLERDFPPANYEVIMGVGYSQMNQVRKNLFLRCKKKGYSVASFIHPTAFVSNGVRLGEGNIILESSVIQPFVTLGQGNLIWHGVQIAHDNEIGNFNTLCQSTSIAGKSQIGDNCFLGNSCVVFGGIHVADYTLVGAGAIVKGDTSPCEVLVPPRAVSLDGRKSTEYI